jgi:hypothetical protein
MGSETPKVSPEQVIKEAVQARFRSRAWAEPSQEGEREAWRMTAELQAVNFFKMTERLFAAENKALAAALVFTENEDWAGAHSAAVVAGILFRSRVATVEKLFKLTGEFLNDGQFQEEETTAAAWNNIHFPSLVLPQKKEEDGDTGAFWRGYLYGFEE